LLLLIVTLHNIAQPKINNWNYGMSSGLLLQESVEHLVAGYIDSQYELVNAAFGTQ